MFIFALTLIPLCGLYFLSGRGPLKLASRINKWSWYGSVLVFIPYVLFSGLVLNDPPRFYNFFDQVIDLGLRSFISPTLFVLFFLLWMPVFGREKIKSEGVSVFLLSFFALWGVEQYARGFQAQDLLNLFIWPILCLAFYFAAGKIIEVILEDRGRWYAYLIILVVYVLLLSVLRGLWIMHQYTFFGGGIVLLLTMLRLVFWNSIQLRGIVKGFPELRIPMKWLGKVLPLIATFFVFVYKKLKLLVYGLIKKNRARASEKNKK